MSEEIFSLLGTICLAVIMGAFVTFEEPELAINLNPAQEVKVDKRNMRGR